MRTWLRRKPRPNPSGSFLPAAHGARSLQQFGWLGSLFGTAASPSASPAAAPDPYTSYYYTDYSDSGYDCLSTFDLIEALNQTDKDVNTFLQAAAVSGALGGLLPPPWRPVGVLHACP